jgi:hypothetical protein
MHRKQYFSLDYITLSFRAVVFIGASQGLTYHPMQQGITEVRINKKSRAKTVIQVVLFLETNDHILLCNSGIRTI